MFLNSSRWNGRVAAQHSCSSREQRECTNVLYRRLLGCIRALRCRVRANLTDEKTLACTQLTLPFSTQRTSCDYEQMGARKLDAVQRVRASLQTLDTTATVQTPFSKLEHFQRRGHNFSGRVESYPISNTNGSQNHLARGLRIPMLPGETFIDTHDGWSMEQ